VRSCALNVYGVSTACVQVYVLVIVCVCVCAIDY